MIKNGMIRRFAAAAVAAAVVTLAVPAQASAADLGRCTLGISPTVHFYDPTLTVGCRLNNPRDGIRSLRIMADDPAFDNGIQQCPGYDLRVFKRELSGHILNEDRYYPDTQDEIYVKVNVVHYDRQGKATFHEIRTNTVSGFWGEPLLIGESNCGKAV